MLDTFRTVGVIQTTGDVQLILTWFAVLFPVLIATCFFIMLWFKPYHLYAPSEYSQSGSASEFIAAIRKDKQPSGEFELVSKGIDENSNIAEQLLVSGIVSSQQKVYVLEKMVEWILSNNTAFVKNLTPEVMNKFRSEASEYGKGLREDFEEQKVKLQE